MSAFFFSSRPATVAGSFFAFLCLGALPLSAATSPYVTTAEDVPLNQATDDSIQGFVTFNSHAPVEGSISSLTDATSPDSPTANVIPGPADNTGLWVGLTWDFGGTAFEIENRQLDGVDIWIAGEDPFRHGFHGDLSISLTGNVNEFNVIPSSTHSVSLGQNSNYNLVRYQFPEGLVTNFQYLRLNLGPDENLPRIVEIDAWVSQIPEPSTYAAIFGGIILIVAGLRRTRARRR